MQKFKKHSEQYVIAVCMVLGIFAIVYLGQSGWVEAKKGEGITYEPYSGVTDHCVTDASGVTNRSLYDILQTIGTSKKATVKFKNDNESGNTTAYKFVSASGADFSSYNVSFEFENGAMLESGTTLSGVTIFSPGNIIAGKSQQIISGTSFYFSSSGVIYPEWFGADGTDDAAAFASLEFALKGAKRLELLRTYDTESTQLSWNVDNLEIFGVGGLSGTTVVNTSGVSGYVLKLLTGTRPVIRDITITANGQSMGALQLSSASRGELSNIKILGDESGTTKYGITIQDASFATTIINPQIRGYFSVGIALVGGHTYKPNGTSIHGGWIDCLSKSASDGILAYSYDNDGGYGYSVYGTYIESFKNAGIHNVDSFSCIWQPGVLEGSGTTAQAGIIIGASGVTGSNNNFVILPLVNYTINPVDLQYGSRNRIYLHSATYYGNSAVIRASSDDNVIFTQYTGALTGVIDYNGNNLVVNDINDKSFMLKHGIIKPQAIGETSTGSGVTVDAGVTIFFETASGISNALWQYGGKLHLTTPTGTTGFYVGQNGVYVHDLSGTTRLTILQ
jgi:hypothetical protein